MSSPAKGTTITAPSPMRTPPPADAPSPKLDHPSAEKGTDITTDVYDEHDPEQHPLAKLGSGRKHALLAIFSIATFVDVCNVAGIGVAVPKIMADLGLQPSQSVWILTAYSLTFASCLLFAGRLSDLFPAHLVFEVGFVVLGALSLVTSFVTASKYGFLILRAISGIAGTMTIPSAYHLLVHMFPDPLIKRKKLAVLGLAASLGNVLGLVLSSLTMLASYHWFFRLMAILCLVFSALTILLLPPKAGAKSTLSIPARLRRLDIVGVLLLASALICFLLGLTQGPIDGWKAASFIAPIVLSVAITPCFFLWESRQHPKYALLPATLWKTKNMLISSITMLLPFSFWVTSQLRFATFWQTQFGWSALHVAAAALPQGIAAVLFGALSQISPLIIHNPRTSVPVGAVLMMIGEVLMYFSDGGPGMDYWRLCFPGFVIGSAGAIMMVMAAGVNLVTYCPPEMAGVAGAWNQTMGQVGCALCLAVQAGLEDPLRPSDWRRNARSFWFEFAAFGVAGLVYAVGYSKPLSPEEEHRLARERMHEVEKRWEGPEKTEA